MAKNQTYKKTNAKKENAYSKGKRWGFAVSKASIGTSKANVHKVDKAMKTCSQNARTGIKKLNRTERDAYRGMADGMYEALRSEEKTAYKKPRANRNARNNRRKRPVRASRHKMVKRRLGQAARRYR